jgi:hypothetical protein
VKFISTGITIVLLITMCGSEIAMNIMRFNAQEKIDLDVCADRAGEDTAEEEGKNETETEELGLKEQLTPDEFGYASLRYERGTNKTITRHDLNYELPGLKAIFSPPETLFS